MPILDVEIVQAADQQLSDTLAGEIADAAGEVFQTPPGRTWVRLRSLPRERYAENGGGPPDGVLPVFVTVLKARKPDDSALAEEVVQLTQRIAQICGRHPATGGTRPQALVRQSAAFGTGL